MAKITYERAKALVCARVEDLARQSNDTFEVLLDQTKDVAQGWVFFYNTTDFVRTRNPAAALAGNGPLLVTTDGALMELPTGEPWERALDRLGKR